MKTIMYKLLLTGILLLTSRYYAQETASTGKLYGGFGAFGFSWEQLNIGSLNTALTGNGYGQLQTSVPSFGGGGYFCIGNILIGGYGSWLSSTQTHNADNSANFKGGYGSFMMGYAFAKGKRSLFYPAIGIGGGGFDLVINEKSSSANFSQQINKPNGTLNAGAGGWIVNAQIGYQRFFGGKDLEGFLVGVKAGYKFSPAWTISSTSGPMDNAPAINMNGLYVTITLGGGGLERHSK
jgi:hypothetical protein